MPASDSRSTSKQEVNQGFRLIADSPPLQIFYELAATCLAFIFLLPGIDAAVLNNFLIHTAWIFHVFHFSTGVVLFLYPATLPFQVYRSF